ncbi:MAG: DUF4442 domain-containing protein [Chitinophagales bacterium]|nr:DUF4442 domain-containing protein [Bacteroidota bacterium]
MNFRNITRLIRFYPTYVGAGISVKSFNDDFTQVTVQMKMHWYNRNAVGTHFGGSLYSMCDPFYMFILMEHLGRDYIVWDKSASIDFVKAEKGTVYATFEIPFERIDEIKADADKKGKGLYTFNTNIVNEHGEIVANVEKVVYVRSKKIKSS